MKFAETMEKYHGIIDNAIYAAEILCPVKDREDICMISQSKDVANCKTCRFKDDLDAGDPAIFECSLLMLRRWCGDRVVQDDIKECKMEGEVLKP
jgi:hypothetical protein